MYTSKSIFLCDYIFEIDISTKHIRSKYTRRVEGIVVKGKDLAEFYSDNYALNRALSVGKIGNKRWLLVDIIIIKYLSEARC